VFDNGSTDDTGAWLRHASCCSSVESVDATDLTLHQMWNRGVAMARARDAVCNVAILNNDLVLGPDFCRSLATALRTDPELWAVSPVYDDRSFGGVQYVDSTFKNGGLAGFAFMVRGEAFDEVCFDENFQWWYGDDDLVAQIRASGHQVGLTDATSVEHLDGGSQSVRYTREVVYTLEQDLLHMHAKWGHV
jgi:GT2 family glycosyltransferase